MGEVMNCKPGDLAYVVHGRQAGAVVSVEKTSLPLEDVSPCWTCTSTSPLHTVHRKTRERRINTRFRVPDSWLRPISGIPVTDDVTENVKEPA